MLHICYSVNRPQVTLLTSSMYKHMKRAATHLFKRQSKYHAFSKLSNFYFDLRPPPLGQTPGQERGAKTQPQGQLECCKSLGVVGGWGGGWSGFELTDPLICDPAFFVHIIKHRSITFVQLVNYPVMDYPVPKIIRRIVNMRIKSYNQLIEIVNFCGKQGNISSSKKTHGSGLLSVVK